MAITLVYGLPGAGKSQYTVEKKILPALKSGRKVITNIPLNLIYLENMLDIDLSLIKIIESKLGDFSDTFKDVSDYKDDWRNERGQAPLIVVDEAHFSLGKNRKKEEIIDIEQFFSIHRHEGYDIILMTQAYSRLPRDVLGFVALYIEIVKQVRISKRSYTIYFRDAERKLQSSRTGFYNKETFKIYKSHMFSDVAIEEDVTADGYKSVFNSWPFWLLGLSLILLVFGFVSGKLNFSAVSYLYSDNDIVKKDVPTLKKEVDFEKLEMVKIDNNNLKTKDQILSNSNVSNIEEIKEIKEVKEFKEIKEVKYLNQNHPLDGKLFQIRNWVGDVAFISLFDIDTKTKTSSITSKDLEKMGYKLDYYSKCSIFVKYQNISFYLDCSNIEKFENDPSSNVLSNVPLINKI